MTGSAATASWRRGARHLSRRDHDDAVSVGRDPAAGLERDATEGDGNVDLPGAVLPARARVRADRGDPEIERRERRRVADTPVDHEPRPAMVDGDARDDVAEECDATGPPTVDDEHPTLTR